MPPSAEPAPRRVFPELASALVGIKREQNAGLLAGRQHVVAIRWRHEHRRGAEVEIRPEVPRAHDYRSKFGLPDTYPTVAPDYAKVRSAVAKKIGLDSGRRAAASKKVDTKRGLSLPMCR
jgi:hypothetical protein